MTSTEPAWIHLDGAVNVRDLAGLPTVDGRRVQPHRLIRADNLQDLSPADVHRLLQQYDVRTVADLRTGVEVDSEGPGPMRSESTVRWHHLSLVPEAGVTTDVTAAEDAAAGTSGGPSVVLPWQAREDELAQDRARRGAAAVYLRYLDERGDTVVEALRVVARSPGATLCHCAAGKDRTGTVVALALHVAGVDRAEIVADYARSGERIEAILGRLVSTPTYAGDIGTDLAEIDVDRHRPRAETMAGFFEVLDAEYAGPSAWLADHGWTAEDTRALRAKLLD